MCPDNASTVAAGAQKHGLDVFSIVATLRGSGCWESRRLAMLFMAAKDGAINQTKKFKKSSVHGF
jgi:hypothetical protein